MARGPTAQSRKPMVQRADARCMVNVWEINSRAVSLAAGGTASSRSRITASAPASNTFVSSFCVVAGGEQVTAVHYRTPLSLRSVICSGLRPSAFVVERVVVLAEAAAGEPDRARVCPACGTSGSASSTGRGLRRRRW